MFQKISYFGPEARKSLSSRRAQTPMPYRIGGSFFGYPPTPGTQEKTFGELFIVRRQESRGVK